jgi:riboflavin synthase
VFTGIVEAVGRVRSVRDVAGARVFGLEVVLAPAPATGDSVAVNGVCLTVERADAGGFDATAVPETLARTTLAELVAGDAVNIERAATLERVFGGHLVQGHVDGVGRVVSLTRAADPAGGGWLAVEVPAEVHDLCVDKGSIAIDGVSLTIARRDEDRAGAAHARDDDRRAIRAGAACESGSRRRGQVCARVCEAPLSGGAPLTTGNHPVKSEGDG